MNEGNEDSRRPTQWGLSLGPQLNLAGWILTGLFGMQLIRELLGQRRSWWVASLSLILVSCLGLALTTPPRSGRTKIAIVVGFVVGIVGGIIMDVLSRR